MRSAFGVEHEPIEKSVGQAFGALKGGFKLKSTVPQIPGKKSTNVSAWNVGSHLGRNKKAYGAGAAGTVAGAGVASVNQPRARY